MNDPQISSRHFLGGLTSFGSSPSMWSISFVGVSESLLMRRLAAMWTCEPESNTALDLSDIPLLRLIITSSVANKTQSWRPATKLAAIDVTATVFETDTSFLGCFAVFRELCSFVAAKCYVFCVLLASYIVFVVELTIVSLLLVVAKICHIEITYQVFCYLMLYKLQSNFLIINCTSKAYQEKVSILKFCKASKHSLVVSCKPLIVDYVPVD